MICPKCSHLQDNNLPECERCGIIFAKVYSRQKRRNPKAEPNKSEKKRLEKAGITLVLIDYLFHTREETNIVFWAGRVLLWGAMVWLSFQCVRFPIEDSYAGNSFMHLINLPFHEAGHVFLRPFGAFLTSLGGSIFQLLVPATCCATLLLKTRDTFGASVALWWFGQNFFDLAPYMNDARSLSLPLVGGNFGHSSPYGFHDWEYILTETGLLQYDHALAKASVGTGTLIFLLALVWGAIVLYKQLTNRG